MLQYLHALYERHCSRNHDAPQQIEQRIPYSSMSERQKEELRQFMTKLASLLVNFGSASYRVEYYLQQIASSFMLQPFSLCYVSTGLLLFFPCEIDSGRTISCVHNVNMEQKDIHLTKLCKLDDLSRNFCNGKVNVTAAYKELDVIEKTRSFSKWSSAFVRLLAVTASSALTSLFFDATWMEISTSAIAGLFVGVLMLLSSMAPLLEKLLLQLFFGIMLGHKLNRIMTLPINEEQIRAPYSAWVYSIALPFVVFCWMILLHCPMQVFNTICIILASYCAFFASYYGSYLNAVELGSFVGIFSASVIGNLYSRVSAFPQKIITTIAVLMLLPGSIGIRSIYALMLGNQQLSINFVYTLLMIGISLAIGYRTAHLLVPPSTPFTL